MVKRILKRRKRKVFRRKRRMRNSLGIRGLMVTHIPSKMHEPYPPCFKTKFYQTYMCILTITKTTNTNPVLIDGNNLYRPFTHTLTTNNITVGLPSTAGAGFAITDCPSGLSLMLGTAQLYQAFTVLSSKISVKFMPQNAVDIVEVLVGPYVQTPTQQLPGSFGSISGSALTRQKVFSSAECNIPLVHKVKTSYMFGVSDKEVISNADYSSASVGVDPTLSWDWLLMWKSANEVATTATMGVEVRLEYDVILKTANLSYGRTVPT